MGRWWLLDTALLLTLIKGHGVEMRRSRLLPGAINALSAAGTAAAVVLPFLPVQKGFLIHYPESDFSRH